MDARLLRLMGASLVSLPLITGYAAGGWGGWAAITVGELPDFLVTRHPTQLTFTVRQHGVHPLDGLKPTVEATSGKLTVAAAATPGAGAGQYAATLTPSEPGEWTITIHSGFNTASVTLLPVQAIAPGARPPAPLADAERGRRLFVAKGCVSCHLHRAVNPNGGGVGPELTGKHFAAEFLTKFLADPAAVIPPRPGSATMPNLELKPLEISALIAFINTEQLSLP